MFLTDLDYKNHQMEKNLEILTKGDQLSTRNFAELAAQEEMWSYLKIRFDVAKIFITVTNWDSQKTYNELDHVVYTYMTKNELNEDVYITSMYYATVANTNEIPTTNPDWQFGDLRNALIVMRMVDMAVYHMYAKIPQRQTPEDVGLRYEEAIKWLVGIAGGKFCPNLPVLESNAPSSSGSGIHYGSKKKINWR